MKQLLILTFCTFGWLSNSAQLFIPGHLDYFGFSVVDCMWDDPNDEGVVTNYLSEVAAFSNTAQLCVFAPTQNVTANIQAMNDECIRPLLAIQSVLFELEDETGPSGENWKLAENFLAQWQTFKTVNGDLLTPDRIAAFYLMDEPFWNGITAQELATATNLVKSDYPNINTCIVEAYPSVGDLVVPESMDWIGFDRYGVLDVTNDAVFQADLQTVKNARSADHQRIVLIAETQWLPFYADFNIAQEDIAALSSKYYDLALADPDVVAVIGYLWPGGLDIEGHLGLRNLPDAVQNPSIEFGEAVKMANNTCVDNISEQFKIDQLAIFPNPSDGRFQLQRGQYFNTVEIRNQTGQLIEYMQIEPTSSLTLKPDLPIGIYWVRTAPNGQNPALATLVVRP